MPQNLQRYQQTREGHFITFSCCRRLPRLRTARARDVFLRVLEKARRRFDFVVMGYVVMPEHVHLLVSEPQRGRLSAAIQVVKQNSSRELAAARAAAEFGASGVVSQRGERRAILAAALLRLQREDGQETAREAEVHAPNIASLTPGLKSGAFVAED